VTASASGRSASAGHEGKEERKGERQREKGLVNLTDKSALTILYYIERIFIVTLK